MKKANACTNFDLKRMIYYLYSNACSSSDYQDAALLCFRRYIFGRASDLTLVHKQNVSIDASFEFFLRFIRMKTCEEQGLDLLHQRLRRNPATRHCSSSDNTGRAVCRPSRPLARSSRKRRS